MNTDAFLVSRRQFLRKTVILGGLAVPSVRRTVRAADVASANGDIRVAILGLGNKGRQFVRFFSDRKRVRIAALCDLDGERLAGQLEKVKEAGATPFTTKDPRRVLDREDVDAVFIATPNHWHALLAVWAMQAGKDVYVEKPVSHTVWEGVRMVEEAAASGRIVQSGTQYRSCSGLRAAADWLKGGPIGKLQWVHIVWFEHRKPIGKSAPYRPTDLDYDLWCGPAPNEPLTRPRLHYDWHWFWSTGNGELGNSTVHPFDACRMFFEAGPFPRRIVSLGGRFLFDDAAQTPNVQYTLIDYPEVPIIMEHRNLSMERDEVVMGHLRGTREGMVLKYEGGYFAGLRGGGTVYDDAGKLLKRFEGDGGGSHAANFLDAVRSRRAEELRAPITTGHVSSAICHLCNISYRLGQSAPLQAGLDTLKSHPEAATGFEDVIAHLEALDVNLQETPFRRGAALEIDTGTGDLLRVGDGNPGQLEQARCMARGTFRAPYLLPA